MARRVSWTGRAGRGAVLAVALGLGACASLLGAGGGKPPAIYELSPPTEFDGIRGRTGAQLLVPVPTAVDAFASERVVVREKGGRLSFYPGVSWSDQLPPLLQTTLVRAFENSKRAKAVGRPGESLAIDYQVIVDIRAFDLDVGAGRSAHVELGVRLLDDRTGKVRATKVFDARVPVASEAPGAVVEALDAAAGKAMTDVVVWAAATI